MSNIHEVESKLKSMSSPELHDIVPKLARLFIDVLEGNEDLQDVLHKIANTPDLAKLIANLEGIFSFKASNQKEHATHIGGSVTGPVLSGTFSGPVEVGASYYRDININITQPRIFGSNEKTSFSTIIALGIASFLFTRSGLLLLEIISFTLSGLLLIWMYMQLRRPIVKQYPAIPILGTSGCQIASVVINKTPSYYLTALLCGAVAVGTIGGGTVIYQITLPNKPMVTTSIVTRETLASPTSSFKEENETQTTLPTSVSTVTIPSVAVPTTQLTTSTSEIPHAPTVVVVTIVVQPQPINATPIDKGNVVELEPSVTLAPTTDTNTSIPTNTPMPTLSPTSTLFYLPTSTPALYEPTPTSVPSLIATQISSPMPPIEATPTSTPTVTSVPTSFGDGRDGPMPASGNLDNNNGFGLGAVNGSSGSTTITVEDRYAVWRIYPGDYVLIHQTRGDGAGTWELNRAIEHITGSGTLNLATALQHTYTSNGFLNRAQIMRVPQYTTCDVTGTVTPLMPWSGDVGGIFAVICQGTLRVSGSISVDAAGFRGGDSGNGYAIDQWQGEGALCMRNAAEHFCKSPDTFAIDQGGGAADAIGGGGGGGGYTSGSDGDHIGGSTWGVGGIGAGALNGSIMLFGGGGGGGATSINPGSGYSQSGRGGGLIYLFANTLVVSGQITAQGQQASGIMYDDGTNRRVTAGSGGGGQMFVHVGAANLGTNQVTALGASQLVPPSGGTGRFGGGAGGNGHVRVEYCSILTGSTTTPADFQQTCSALQ